MGKLPRVPRDGGRVQGWESVCWWGVPRYWFSEMYHNISRCQRFEVIDFPRCTKIPKNDLRTVLKLQHSSTIIQQVSNIFKTYFRCSPIDLDSKIIQHYFRFSRLYQDSTMLFPFVFFKTSGKARCVDPSRIKFELCCPAPFPIVWNRMSKTWDL